MSMTQRGDICSASSLACHKHHAYPPSACTPICACSDTYRGQSYDSSMNIVMKDQSLSSMIRLEIPSET